MASGLGSGRCSGLFVFHWIAFGDFFLYLKAQRLYGRDFEMEAMDYAIRNNPDLVNTGYDLAFTAIAILLGIVALRRLRTSYGVYMLVSLGSH